ncbi:MAG TPA: hypothetical protein PKA80_13350, partial [Ignavibacteriaceae bacterium]|nr:hypothetical protein [Ignavibacteriaceae bacterium]
MITTNLHKYEISLSNGASIQINETICNPPLQFGRVNPFIVSRISDYYSNDTPFLFLDFTSSQLTKKIPFNYINKKNIDDLAIFLPNSNRAVGLSNGNILSQCIIANNLLEHFDYKLIKSDFTE